MSIIKKTRYKVTAMMLAFMLAVGMMPIALLAAEPPKTTFTVQGRAVVQGETTGVEGATVKIWYRTAYESPAGVEPSQQVITDGSGNYSISGIPGGGHYMEASKDGYVEAKITFNLDGNNDPNSPVEMYDFKLTKLGGYEDSELPNAPIITINTQPAASSTVTQGDNLFLSISASVSNNAALYYQWQASSQSDTGFVDVSAATSSFGVNTENPGIYYYRCIVSADGAISVTSSVAKVTVGANGAASIPPVTTPAIPSKPDTLITVLPTPSKVFVNGVEMGSEAYNIAGSNYFKLRDIAFALNGTAKQFNLSYDSTTSAINLITGSPYIPAGGEMMAGDGQAKTATLTPSKIYLNGGELNLTVYSIGGNNFFKLADLMGVLNVGVTFNQTTGSISVDTNANFMGVGTMQ